MCSEKITIYSYKSSIVDKKEQGIPVVLNFTGSNCFLRCCREGDKVVLQVEVITITEGVYAYVGLVHTVISHMESFQ